MKIRKITNIILTVTVILLSAVSTSFATSGVTFQTYIAGAIAGDIGPDEDTWFSTEDLFSLYVVGSYGPNTVSLDNVVLMISVPEGEQGTITFMDTGDGTPSLLTAKGPGVTGDANVDILLDVEHNDGFKKKKDFASFINLNNHYPAQDGVSDFLLYSLGSFSDDESQLKNYDADTGLITTMSGSTGEQKEYQVSVTGFSSVHFDVYGFNDTGCKGAWEQNPGSHDSTWTPDGHNEIPEPFSSLLLSLGLIGLGFRKRFS